MRDVEHHFKVEDATKYGIEKAILLYNLRFWLEKNKVNAKNINEKDGKQYYWTYNSSKAFAKLFPYLSDRMIKRHLAEMKKDGIIITGEFNIHAFDRTQWYTLPEYSVDNNETQCGPDMDSAESRSVPAIPYSKPDNKPYIIGGAPDSSLELPKDDIKQLANFAKDEWNKYSTWQAAGKTGKPRNTTTLNKLLPQCRELNNSTILVFKTLNKKEPLTKESILLAIKNYLNDVTKRDPSKDYALHRFSFYKFFKQENGFISFLNN